MTDRISDDELDILTAAIERANSTAQEAQAADIAVRSIGQYLHEKYDIGDGAIGPEGEITRGPA